MRRTLIPAWLMKPFRDPVWTFIALLITVILFFVGIALTQKNEVKKPRLLLVEYHSGKDLSDLGQNVADRARIFIDKTEQRDLGWYSFTVEYIGSESIRVADFDQPLAGVVPVGRKILTVQKASTPSPHYSRNFETGEYEKTKGSLIEFDVLMRDDRRFEIRPQLMNPNDWFEIEIVTVAAGDPETSSEAINSRQRKMSVPQTPAGSANSSDLKKYETTFGEVTWSCHIAGVKCPADFLDEFGVNPRQSRLPFLEVEIDHSGWAVYGIVFGLVLNLTVSVLLAKSLRIEQVRPVYQLLLFWVFIILSVTSAEVVVGWLDEKTSDAWLGVNTGQPWWAWSFVWCDAAVITLMLLSLVARRRRGVRGKLRSAR